MVRHLITLTILHDEHVLLARYRGSRDNDKSGLSPPHTFLQHQEPPATAIKRLLEESGASTPDLESRAQIRQIESIGDEGGDWTLLFHYLIPVTERFDSAPVSERIESTEWVATDQLENVTDLSHNGWAKFVVQSCF